MLEMNYSNVKLPIAVALHIFNSSPLPSFPSTFQIFCVSESILLQAGHSLFYKAFGHLVFLLVTEDMKIILLGSMKIIK